MIPFRSNYGEFATIKPVEFHGIDFKPLEFDGIRIQQLATSPCNPRLISKCKHIY